MPDLTDAHREAAMKAAWEARMGTGNGGHPDRDPFEDGFCAALAAAPREDEGLRDYDAEADKRPFTELTFGQQMMRERASYKRQLDIVDRELRWEGTSRGRLDAIRLLARGNQHLPPPREDEGLRERVEGVVRHSVSDENERKCVCPNCKRSPGGHIYGYHLDLEGVPKWFASSEQQDWHEWISHRLYALGREGAGKRVRLIFEVVDPPALAASPVASREDGQEREANAGESSQAFNEKRMDAEYVGSLIYAGEWSKVREWIERRVPVAPRGDEGLRDLLERWRDLPADCCMDPDDAPEKARQRLRDETANALVAAAPVASREGEGGREWTLVGGPQFPSTPEPRVVLGPRIADGERVRVAEIADA